MSSWQPSSQGASRTISHLMPFSGRPACTSWGGKLAASQPGQLSGVEILSHLELALLFL